MRLHVVAGLCLILSGFYNQVNAQQLRLGDLPIGMEKSAVLDLSSSRQGLLLPRISDTSLINSLVPPDGMIIYHTGTAQLLIRKNSYWSPVVTSVGLTTDDISEGLTNKYYTDSRARAAISATTPLSYNNSTGVFSITQAGGSSNGYLSSADWTTFNAKQTAGNYITALTGDVTAAGPGSAVASIAPNAVSFAKMQAITANKLLGSGASGTAIREISLGAGLSFTGTTLNGTGGTLTSLSISSANGFSGTVTNPTTTPAITLSTSISGMLKGSGSALVAATAGIDYQAPITLTTTGGSGAATLLGNTLNIPNYDDNPMTTLGDIIYGGASGTALRLGGNTANSKRFLTSTGNGTIAAAPAWTALASADVTTALGFTPYNSTNPNGYTSNTGTVTSVSVANANGFSGTVATSTTTPSLTLRTSVTGIVKGNGTALSAAVAGTDYQAPITLTTTGSTGAATLTGSTLNIPNLSNATVGLNLTSTSGSVAVSGSPATLGGAMTLNVPFSYFARSSQSIDLPSIGGNSHLVQSYTVTGAQVGDYVAVNPGADMINGSNPVGIGFAYVSATNTVTVDFFTPTNQSVNLPAITYYFTIMR